MLNLFTYSVEHIICGFFQPVIGALLNIFDDGLGMGIAELRTEVTGIRQAFDFHVKGKLGSQRGRIWVVLLVEHITQTLTRFVDIFIGRLQKLLHFLFSLLFALMHLALISQVAGIGQHAAAVVFPRQGE